VRFEEVSLGYPAQWRQSQTVDQYLRPILPAPSPGDGWGDAATIIRHW
jgi:Ni/Co efflux regulator RcnB